VVNRLQLLALTSYKALVKCILKFAKACLMDASLSYQNKNTKQETITHSFKTKNKNTQHHATTTDHHPQS
jgi:hypothetical protein